MLNQRQEKFCLFYTGSACGDATKAYEMAGFKGGNKKSIHSSSTKLVKRDIIQKRIAELRKEAENKLTLSREDCLKILSGIATTAPRDSDRLKAIEIIAKRQGYNEPEKAQLEISRAIDLSGCTDKQLAIALASASENTRLIWPETRGSVLLIEK